MIRRDAYLKELADSMWNGQVKVVTGSRQNPCAFRDS